MNTISNNYEKVLKEIIINQLTSNLKKELNKINTNNIFNYIDLITNLDETLCDITKKILL